MLSDLPVPVLVKARLHSGKECITWLSENTNADIIFSDIQLSDGVALEIFEQINISAPVIFITDYNKYFMRTFETNGIDYLLKPLDQKQIEKSIANYHSLQTYFTNNRMNMPLRNLQDFISRRQKAKSAFTNGTGNITLLPENVALFCTENNLTRIINHCSKKYACHKTLTELEDELDAHVFFRANRQYIINIGFIKYYTSFEDAKLKVEMDLHEFNSPIIISQETAPKFETWMEGE